MSDRDPKEIAQRQAAAECPKPGEVWAHYKGGFYTVVAAAVIEETCEPAVVYRSHLHGTILVRPLSNWRETVTVNHGGSALKVPRFKRVETVL